MKRKLAETIVRLRIPILIAMAIITAVCVTTIGKTNINYDLTRYLADDTMTRRALRVMDSEFGSSEQLRLMFTDRSEAEMDEITAALKELPEVRLVIYDPEENVKREGDGTFHLVTLMLNECDAPSLVFALREMFPDAGDYYVGGTSALQLDLQERVADEIPLVMLISVAIVLIVLLLTSRAWLEPLVILPVLGVSIIINMGTNFMFRDISFITFAVCAILQLALSIDYAIMLLHTWNDARCEGLSAVDAMKEAMTRCMMRIASSALTTVAGLLSLLFMSVTIGFDIGLALSKGILISMLCVFLLMPSVALLLEKPIAKSAHKPLRLSGAPLAKALNRSKKPLAVVLIIAVICGARLTSVNEYSFSVSNDASGTENEMIDKVFGASNPLALLVPGGDSDEDIEKQRGLAAALMEIRLPDGSPAVNGISAMVTTGAKALECYTPEEVAEMTGQSAAAVRMLFVLNGFGEKARADRLLDAAGAFSGDGTVSELADALRSARDIFIGTGHSRMVLETSFMPSSEGFTGVMEEMLRTVREFYGDDFYMTGLSMSNYEIGRAFTGDLLKVNIITLLAILAIVLISFRAVKMPLILVFVIEGAIFISMGISRIIGEKVFFMAYLICLAIQMGATIDYGILLCDQYRSFRREGLTPADALREALDRSMPTIFTSGTILVTAGFIIGVKCSVYYIYAIGQLLARGALISVILVLTLLPVLLLLSERRGAEKGA